MKKTTAYARKRRAMGLPVQPDAHTITLPVNIRFARKHEIDLQLDPHTVLDKFRECVADDPDWHLLNLRVNWGKVLSEAHWPQYTDDMIAAQEALTDVQARHGKTGKWGFSQLEYVAIGDALNSADALQLHCTRRELRDGLEAVYRENAAVGHHKTWRAMESA